MTVAVGWVGIEIAQLILGLVGLTTDDAGVVRATRVVMEILGIELIAGIAWTALLTGLLLATATQWGLLKHQARHHRRPDAERPLLPPALAARTGRGGQGP
ncbi:hypothetical protein OG765_28615 [Streptomyces sp. NBC_00555]|uniref:hypothetical protein n=1 Tax=unclassified Streptomyces TaxID=2593676 RepID=UPI00214C325E|nr:MULTISPECIES: hypothetical protein [unclassified Streptomyces]MCX5014920.1 hypothetical protein [Streptomyces sp. NBC_00555]UUU37795.1 hypothetical protein JIW86_02075 [Streptomyces sp. NBC_00162]